MKQSPGYLMAELVYTEGAEESLGVKILVRSHRRHETVFSLLQENFLVTISIEILVIGSPLSYVYS